MEGGVDRLRIPNPCKKLVSLLAATGFIHTIIIGIYLLPYQSIAQRVDTIPDMKSYMSPGACGAGTDYACPSRDHVPVPSKGSLHIQPDDPRLPDKVKGAG